MEEVIYRDRHRGVTFWVKDGGVIYRDCHRGVII